MSDGVEGRPLGPRVIEVEREEAPPTAGFGPQVIVTEATQRVSPIQPAGRPALPTAPARPRRRGFSIGLTGLGLAIAGGLGVDAYWWAEAAFEHSAPLGVLAGAAVLAGVIGAGTIILREVRSLWRLRDVESIRQRFAEEVVRPRDARQIIADVLAVVPKEQDTVFAIEAFQRQVQAHHTVSQQVEILSRTVMQPLDRRAEAHVRTAVIRAFGITAISPTALSDAAFFLACGVRMVRMIAASYGHRPTAAATVHLLRRLVLEAGKLGAVDIASAAITQQLGGAVAERLASTAADSFYAAYRMARLGVIVMDLCRPVPFQSEEVPSITSLVSNAIKNRPEPPR